MARLPRKNDEASIAARQEALGLDGEVTALDLSPWTGAAESVTGVAVVPVSVAQLRVSLGRYELSDEGDVVETGRDEEEVVVPLAHTEGGLTASVQRGAKAAADGHTLTVVTNSTLAIVPALRQVPYDPVKDFAPIGMIGVSPYVVIVHPSVPAHSIKELVALVKSRPGDVDYGSGGVGTPGHLAGAMLNTMTGIRMNHVPYRAGNLALTDLLGGNISVTFSTTITSTQLIRAGRVRALAATSRERIPAFPELPTVAESGVPGYEFTLWLGLAAPAGTADAIIGQLSRALAGSLQRKDLRDQLASQSIQPSPSTSGEFAEKIRRDQVVYARLVKDAGVRAE